MVETVWKLELQLFLRNQSWIICKSLSAYTDGVTWLGTKPSYCLCCILVQRFTMHEALLELFYFSVTLEEKNSFSYIKDKNFAS